MNPYNFVSDDEVDTRPATKHPNPKTNPPESADKDDGEPGLISFLVRIVLCLGLLFWLLPHALTL